jgi:hypothetical protein
MFLFSSIQYLTSANGFSYRWVVGFTVRYINISCKERQHTVFKECHKKPVPGKVRLLAWTEIDPYHLTSVIIRGIWYLSMRTICFFPSKISLNILCSRMWVQNYTIMEKEALYTSRVLNPIDCLPPSVIVKKTRVRYKQYVLLPVTNVLKL